MLNLHNAEFIRSAVKEGDFPHDGLPQIVFAGKSNVGKSSTINKILNRKNFARVGNQPGKTIHINYFLIDKQAYFVDLPGYGYAEGIQGRTRPLGTADRYVFCVRADYARRADRRHAAQADWGRYYDGELVPQHRHALPRDCKQAG